MTSPIAAHRTAIVYKHDCDGVDWSSVKRLYEISRFDNGRSPAVLRRAFLGSYCVCFALDGNVVVGTARAISDGVTCATIFDVCVHPNYRRRSIGRQMMRDLTYDLRGQYILLTTPIPEFYAALGFQPAAGAMVTTG